MSTDDRVPASESPAPSTTGAASSADEMAGGSSPRSRSRAVIDRIPGLLLAVAVAVLATGAAAVIPAPVSAVALAVVFGLAIGQLVPRSPFAPGVDVATKRILRLGIVLLGARLSLVDVAQLGVGTVGLVVATLTIGLSTAWFLGRRVGLSRELSVLLGIGSAVCGNTAIMASAPVIKARSRDVGLAVATITLCGTVALLVYPPIGRALGMDSTTFGIWVGLAVQDTSQVVATGAAFSEEARDVATVVKLVRNTFLAVLLPALAWVWQRTGSEGAGSVSIRKAFPMFVLGFLAVATLRTVGLIGDDLASWLGEAANTAILVAVAGLGLSVDAADLKKASGRAVAVGGLTAILLGVCALAAAVFVGPRL